MFPIVWAAWRFLWSRTTASCGVCLYWKDSGAYHIHFPSSPQVASLETSPWASLFTVVLPHPPHLIPHFLFFMALTASWNYSAGLIVLKFIITQASSKQELCLLFFTAFSLELRAEPCMQMFIKHLGIWMCCSPLRESNQTAIKK